MQLPLLRWPHSSQRAIDLLSGSRYAIYALHLEQECKQLFHIDAVARQPGKVPSELKKGLKGDYWSVLIKQIEPAGTYRQHCKI